MLLSFVALPKLAKSDKPSSLVLPWLFENQQVHSAQRTYFLQKLHLLHQLLLYNIDILMSSHVELNFLSDHRKK